MLTPNNSVAETDVVAMPGMMESNQEIASFLRENGVSVRFFQGSHNLDGFSLITGNIPYVAINTRRSLATQRYVAQRELSHILLGHLSEGKCSLFLSEAEKRQAAAHTEVLALNAEGGAL